MKYIWNSWFGSDGGKEKMEYDKEKKETKF